MKKKAEGGDKAAQAELLLLQTELGHLPPDEVRKRMEQTPLSAEQKAKLESVLARAEVRAILGAVRQDPATQREAGRKLLELKNAGKPAPVEEQEVFAYWLLIMTYAESEKKAGAFEEALGALKTRLSGNPNAKKFLDEKQAVLERLKAGDGK
jgi:hypothetical protein